VEISIADNGPGIPTDQADRIFEPLFSTKAFGFGLGLSIVKQVVEQHRGGIEVDSEAGRGTRIVVWLPLPVPLQRAAS
jgi:signal transduction histidine kinase